MLYEKILRPILFTLDAERAHSLAMGAAQIIASTPLRRCFELAYTLDSSVLEQDVFGYSFRNPIGIAGGFDKKGTFSDAAAMLGAGFHEVGSVSLQARMGNPLPRLIRIPEEKALVNKMGLNNDGAVVTASRIEKALCRIPLIVNIAKTHDSAIVGDAAIADYCESVRLLAPVADLLTLNISCPNTKEGITFQDPLALADLLNPVTDILRCLRSERAIKGQFGIKIGPDVLQPASDGHYRQLESIVDISMQHGVAYFVCCNTLPTQHPQLQKCGKSGLPLSQVAKQGVAALYQLVGKTVPIIGVGGVFNADDAYSMLEAGASLVQIYTGLVYKGPSVFHDINKGLVRRAKADGIDKLSSIVGRSHKKVLEEAAHG